MNQNFLVPSPGSPEQLPQRTSGGALTVPSAIPHTGPDLSIAEIWRILLKWRWLIAGLAAAGLALAIAVTFLTTPIYRGTVVLEINQEPTQVIEVGNVQPVKVNDSDYMATQYGLLKSRSLAERVARHEPDHAHVGHQRGRVGTDRNCDLAVLDPLVRDRPGGKSLVQGDRRVDAHRHVRL